MSAQLPCVPCALLKTELQTANVDVSKAVWNDMTMSLRRTLERRSSQLQRASGESRFLPVS